MVTDYNPEPDRDDLSVSQCLEVTLKDFNCGEIPMQDGNKPTKVIVMFLDDSPGRYDVKVLCGSDADGAVRASTIISAMELYKYNCLKALND